MLFIAEKLPDLRNFKIFITVSYEFGDVRWNARFIYQLVGHAPVIVAVTMILDIHDYYMGPIFPRTMNGNGSLTL